MATIVSWDSGTLPTVVGGVTSGGAVGFPATPALLFQQVGGATAVARWDVTSTGNVCMRGYVRTPAAWTSSAVGFAFFLVGGTTQIAYAAFSGTGSPGEIRLYRTGGAIAAQSSAGLLTLNTTYRFELQINTSATRARLALFPINSDTAVWESGWITHANYGVSVTRIEVGNRVTSPTIGTFWMDTILATNDNPTTYLGRATGDDLPPPPETGPTFTVWDGDEELEVFSVTVWDGDEELEVAEIEIST